MRLNTGLSCSSDFPDILVVSSKDCPGRRVCSFIIMATAEFTDSASSGSKTSPEPGALQQEHAPATAGRPSVAPNTEKVHDGKVEISEDDCYDDLGFRFPTLKKWYIITVVFWVQVLAVCLHTRQSTD